VEATLLSKGQAAYIAGEYGVAVECFSELVKLAPLLPDTYHTLGLIYEDSGQIQEALQMFALAATNDPRNIDLWRKVMSLSMETEQWSQAMGAIVSVLRLDETSTDAIFSRPFVTLELGDESKAFEQLVTGLKKHPSHVDELLDFAGLCQEKSLMERSAQCHIRYIFCCICRSVQLPSEILSAYSCVCDETDAPTAAIGDVFYACSAAVSWMLGLCDMTILIKLDEYGFDAISYAISDAAKLQLAHMLVDKSIEYARKEIEGSDAVKDAFIPMDIAIIRLYIDLIFAIRDQDNDEGNNTKGLVHKLVDLLEKSRVRIEELISRSPGDGISEEEHKRPSEASILCCLVTRAVGGLARLGLKSLSAKYIEALMNILASNHYQNIQSKETSVVLLELACIQHKLNFPVESVAKMVSASVSCWPNNTAALLHSYRLYNLESSSIEDPTLLFSAHYTALGGELIARLNENGIDTAMNCIPLDTLKSLLEISIEPEAFSRGMVYSKPFLWDEPSFHRRLQLELFGLYNWSILLRNRGHLDYFISLSIPIIDMWRPDSALFVAGKELMPNDFEGRKRKSNQERSGLSTIFPAWLGPERSKFFMLCASICVGCWASASKGSMHKILEATLTNEALEDLVVSTIESLWRLGRLQLARHLAASFANLFESSGSSLLSSLQQGLFSADTTSSELGAIEVDSDLNSNNRQFPSLLLRRNAHGKLMTLAMADSTLSGSLRAQGSVTNRQEESVGAPSTPPSAKQFLDADIDAFFCNPESIDCANRLFRTLWRLRSAPHGGSMACDLDEAVDVPGLLSKYPRSPPLLLLASTRMFSSKNLTSSLNRLVDAFLSAKNQPLTSLCLALLLLVAAAQNTQTSSNKEYFVAALASLNQYAGLRLGCQVQTQSAPSHLQSMTAIQIKQEVLFNIARFYDDINVKDVAESFYRKVLDLAPNPSLQQSDATSHLVRKAAFNLVQIYKSSQSRNRATEIMLKYLDMGCSLNANTES
jgi:tetratricopeptide (TPR) repeat protein